MRRAIGRANAALEQKGQKVGAMRYANLDVRQIVGTAVNSLGSVAQTVEVTAGTIGAFSSKKAVAPPPQLPHPEKITVSAAVQCASKSNKHLRAIKL